MERDVYIKFSTPTFNHFTAIVELYDAVRSLVASNFALPEDVVETDGKTFAIKATWTLKRSATAVNTTIDSTNRFIILDKASYLGKYTQGVWDCNRISGAVDTSMDGHTDLTYGRSDGQANITMRINCPFGVEAAAVGIWPFSQGTGNRANMISGYRAGVGIINIQLVVSPTVKYYAVAKGHGSNMTAPFIIEPVGALGGVINTALDRIDKSTGLGLIPVVLTTEQTRIANMFVFDATTQDIEIKLPTDYASDARWDATNRIWQFLGSDFDAIAYKVDHIQTTAQFMARTQRVFFSDNKMELSSDVHAGLLKQSATNATTAGGAVKISLNQSSVSQFGDSFQKNTFIDNSNGVVDVVGGNPLSLHISGQGLTPAQATKLDKITAISLSTSETHQRLALDRAKPLTSKPDGGITSTGISITATELADGSVVQTRGT
ncbi:hypothetical protein BJAS_P3407 [Bathymodiolus japonicus methanotrophic gill symbiont]|uniref:hypothetical protein n=1 Tax=Bathymodiolus japonicus methanotrophic gill symbiont TaxID=113269 RepID=UPI001B71FBA8|nr:hypothetical protein [Bathymodiolus japonicus methanotrophic gill symbiont]GFO72871.1 hypothetical protein BJAS_P3407 [Bathymodiolus japonicus methanotrophic gill symbiont]